MVVVPVAHGLRRSACALAAKFLRVAGETCLFPADFVRAAISFGAVPEYSPLKIAALPRQRKKYRLFTRAARMLPIPFSLLCCRKEQKRDGIRKGPILSKRFCCGQGINGPQRAVKEGCCGISQDTAERQYVSPAGTNRTV